MFAAALVLGQLAGGVPAVSAAAPAGVPTFRPARTARAPAIDGDLSDAAWADAPETTAFRQKFPREGAAPSERTTLKILYDDDALYVAFDVVQTTAAVVAPMARRDRDIESDSVTIDIDSRGLLKNAFEFTVTAAGVLQDGIRSNDVIENGNHYSPSWDENWEARTTARPDGWSAEIRIPLRILRFSSGTVQSWGFQARRYTSMKQETDEWSLVPRSAASEVSLYGRLEGLRVRPKSEIELRPFATGSLVRRDPTPGIVRSGASASASVGLDLRWHLTPDLTLDGTVNPDFTQVEGDELFLNLSSFESFFPEKRPFFVEGAEILETPAPLFFARPFQLLYTRRIGRRSSPPALPSDANGPTERLVAPPDAATILGATKLVGRIAPGWSVGAMTALTAAREVETEDATGARRLRLVDPTSLFHVVRVKREFEGGKLHVGFLGTAVARAERTSLYPLDTSAGRGAARQLCASGADTKPGERCTHDAYVGSIDGLWRSDDGDIFVSAQAISSVIRGGPARSLRDGTVIAAGDAGYGAQLIAARDGGAGLAWNAQYQLASRKLDFNDVGFMERQNQHFYYGVLEYRTFEPFGPTLETHSFLETEGRVSLDGVKVSRRWLTDAFVRYQSFWTTYLELHYEEPRFDDREIGTGQPFERPGHPGVTVQVNSDKRRAIYVESNFTGDVLPHGSLAEGHVRSVLRIHPQVEMELVPSFSFTAGETRFVGNAAGAGDLTFGKLRASSFATTARLNVSLTPRLSFQSFGQVFVAAGHYDDFRSFGPSSRASGDDRRIRIDDLTPVAAPAQSPDFNDVSLNVSVVGRWEYSLGSILYLVYNRSQTPAATADADVTGALSFTPLARAPAVDTVLVKWQLYFLE